MQGRGYAVTAGRAVLIREMFSALQTALLSRY